jgi:hypothetical protein
MVSTARLYYDATLALAFMGIVGVLSGFAAALFSGDRFLTILFTVGGFVLTGAILVYRLWRITRPAIQGKQEA